MLKKYQDSSSRNLHVIDILLIKSSSPKPSPFAIKINVVLVRQKTHKEDFRFRARHKVMGKANTYNQDASRKQTPVHANAHDALACSDDSVQPSIYPHIFAEKGRSLSKNSSVVVARRSRRGHEEHDCPDCHVLQMRRHILDTCPRYQRPRPNFSEFLKNSSKPGAQLLNFLQTNPSAFTFADAPTPS